MKVRVLVHVFIIGVASAASYLNGCSKYVISTEATLYPGASDCDCEVTIKQLFICLSTRRISPPGPHTGETNSSSTEFLFQSGIHLIDQGIYTIQLFYFLRVSALFSYMENQTL